MGVNITHLLTKVKYRQDRVLFKEACICADNNALNSCFLTLWIALVQSLKWRFIEIAKKDNEMGKIVGEITSKESKHQSVDKYLIDQGCKYGFYDDKEKNDFEHLLTKRSLIIHPYMSKASEADIVYAATVIVESLLSKEIMLRRAFCEAFVGRLIIPHYIEHSHDAVIAHVKGIIANIDPSLTPWLIRRYLRELKPIYLDRALRKRKTLIWRGVWVITHILISRKKLFTHSEYHDLFMEYPDMLSAILGNPIIFRTMDDKTKHSIVQFLIDSHKEQPHRLWILEELFNRELLQADQERSFKMIIKGSDFELLVDSGLSFRCLINKATQLLQERDFRKSNLALEYIESNLSSINEMEYSFQLELGLNLMSLIKRNSFRAQEFLGDLKVYDPPIGLLTGLLYANLVNPTGYFTLKYDYLGRSAVAVSASSRKNEVIELLKSELNKSRNSFSHFDEKKLDMIDQAIDDKTIARPLVEYLTKRKNEEKEVSDG